MSREARALALGLILTAAAVPVPAQMPRRRQKNWTTA